MTIQTLGGRSFGGGAAPPRHSERWAIDRGRLSAIVLTVLAHIAVLGILLTAIHVAPALVSPAIIVHVDLEKPKVSHDILPPPILQQPALVTVPIPEISIQTESSPIVVKQQPTPKAQIAPPQLTLSVQSSVHGISRDTFLARLLAQLNNYKRYPPQARHARIEGVVMLHFVMNAEGRVLSFEISKSSGRPALDEEVVSLIQRAQPLPSLPPDFTTKTFEAIVPIVFSLRS